MFVTNPLGRLARGLGGNRDRLQWLLKRAGEQRSAMFNEAWIGLAILLLMIGFLVGHVVDFISVFSPDGHYFAIFNVADSALCCGVALAILLELTGRRRDGTRLTKTAQSARD